MHSHTHVVLPWAVRRIRLPLLALRCVNCGALKASTGTGKFRVNANGKALDIWLLVDCLSCNRTGKITVRERVPVRSLDPAELYGFETNDPGLVARALLDPLIARRNRFTLDWNGAWRLITPPAPPSADWPVQVRVEFVDPIPIRPERLITRGLGISRKEIEQRIKIDIPLNRKTKADFTFTIHPQARS